MRDIKFWCMFDRNNLFENLEPKFFFVKNCTHYICLTQRTYFQDLEFPFVNVWMSVN